MMRCERCGQQFVSPRSERFADLYETAEYFHGMNETNRLAAACRKVWFAARHRLIAAAGAPSGSLVEIGPSWGEFVRASIGRGYRVAASEYSEPAADVVRTTFGIPVQSGAFDPEFFRRNGFGELDAVCLWDVIEHVPDPAAFLDALASICKPGAVLAFSCPDVSTPFARLMGSRWPTFKPDEHLWHFDKTTIRALLGEHGFDVRWLSSSPFRRAQLLRFDCMTGVAVRRGEPQPVG
jgi:SAM-dependent methyltransferase